MKRIFALFFALVMLLSLAACGGKAPEPAPESPKPEQPQEAPAPGKVPEKNPEAPPAPTVVPLQIMKGTDSVDEWDDDFNQLISAEWEDIAPIDAYPALSAALFELNNDQSVGAYSFIQEWLPDAREFRATHPDFFGGFTYASAYTVQRADSLVLSLREDFSSYTGGVHGYYGVMGWSFDTVSGAQLKLEDVLTDTAGLAEILAGKLREKYPYEPFESLDEMLADYAPENYTWTLDYQGITFYFNPYEIASYASGLLTATIWFDDMPELFVEKYTIAPETGWAKMLPVNYDIDVDLNTSDGKRDTLSVNTMGDEYGSLRLYVILNGGPEQHLEECYGFTMKPLLVCLGEAGSERYFLYVEASAENDYRTLYIYDLNNGTPQLISDFSGAGFVGVWDPEAGDDGLYYRAVFNDPSAFTLGSRCNLLGTKTAYRDYSVNSDGTLRPLSEAYDLDEDLIPIISTIPLDVTLLPQNTVKTVPAGTEFSFLRTDNETWVDLAMPDGQECRIVIEEIDWTPTINGIPEWDCFENLMYAG